MLKENCIKILAPGLSCIKNSYRNVLDIKQAEKDGTSDTFAFSGIDFTPNSAEKYNLSLRKKYQIQCFDASEITQLIRTRRFAYSYAKQIIETAEYLIKVLELAKDVNSGLEQSIKNEKSIKRNTKLSKEDKEYQLAKVAVNNYVDILIEIKTRITDITNNECNHCIERAYAGLDTRVRSMLATSYIPDELAESFNALYEKYPLRKFSNAKEEGLSKITTFERFKDLSTRLYSAGLKPFLSEIMDVFYFFVTPENFLNNPSGKTVLVIPLSFYKKFNFARSGLTREEVVFIDSNKSMEKNTKNLSLFYTELSEAMDCVYKKLSDQKLELFDSKDKYEIESIIKAYENFFCSKTEGNIRSVKEMLKNPFFREKFTVLLFELRPELIVNVLQSKQNPWERARDFAEDDKLDTATTIYLYNLLLLCFGDKKFPSQRIQLIRFLHIFSYNEKPEKSYSRYVKCIENGGLSWDDSELSQTFKAALER